MAVSPHFRHINSTEEQELYHKLAEESIFLSGIDVYYIKSGALENGEYDELFGENRFEVLDNATPIEMYLENMETPYMGGDMFSKFGLQQNQICNFVVAYRRFESVFGHRPKEGDYIFIPVFASGRGPGDLFRIAFVDVDKNQFETLGSPLFYQIKAERADYARQTVNTGVNDIDVPSVNRRDNDSNDDSSKIEELGDLFIDFDEKNPFGNL